MTHLTRSPLSAACPALLGLSLVGCGHVRIHDMAVIGPAGDLGDASAALVTTPATAPDELVEQRARDVEDALVELALAHDAWVMVPTDPPSVAPLSLQTTGLTWDGRRLQGGVSGGAGSMLGVDLRFRTGGTRSAGGTGQGPEDLCPGGEWTGSNQDVQCPPFVSRSVEVERTLEVDGVEAQLRLRADYGLRLDGDDCAAGGQVDVYYVLEPGEGLPERGGFVSAERHGCDRVAASTLQR